MLFSYPSFINKSEQYSSRLLFNSISMALQTNLREIWYDINFGTGIRDYIKHGIDALVMAQIQEDINSSLSKYFENDIELNYLDVWQESEKIKVALNYTELRTGKKLTVQTEQRFVNDDVSLY